MRRGSLGLRLTAAREGLGDGPHDDLRLFGVEIGGELVSLQIRKGVPLHDILGAIESVHLLIDGVSRGEWPAASADEVDARLHVLETDGQDLASEDFDCALGGSHKVNADNG